MLQQLDKHDRSYCMSLDLSVCREGCCHQQSAKCRPAVDCLGHRLDLGWSADGVADHMVPS